MNSNDTIAGVATGPHESAIAIVRISGPDTAAVAARTFRPVSGENPADLAGYSVRYGHIIDPSTGGVTDDGLLTTFRAPHSYTGEDSAEISCHGGRVTVARVLSHVLAAGIRAADPGEFTLRAFVNGRMDLAQAEAVAALVRARSEAGRRAARRQLEGALSQRIREIKDELVGLLAAIEVTIDFGDDVGPLDADSILVRLAGVEESVDALLRTADRGRVLREGLRAAIVGRPNVGKSSLLNALLRADRAIVTPIAGTTRDILEESANLQGQSLVLVDTAGVQNTEDPVERIGVERAEAAASACDVLLFVIEAAGLSEADREAWRRLAPSAGDRIVIAVNKIDLADDAAVARTVAEVSELAESCAQGGRSESKMAVVAVSALTGEGADRLESALASAAGDAGGESDVVLITERHRQALEQTAEAVRHSLRTVRAKLPADFISIDVNGALACLSEITGERVSDEVIQRIFQDFCVGK
jgi:tRNA modification GTPase